MQYCIQKKIADFIILKYNNTINIEYSEKQEGIVMQIAIAVLTFIGNVIPLVQELLKAFM